MGSWSGEERVEQRFSGELRQALGSVDYQADTRDGREEKNIWCRAPPAAHCQKPRGEIESKTKVAARLARSPENAFFRHKFNP